MSTVWQVESGTCTGRGFAAIDPDGFLSKFYDYIVKAPAAGGPGWFLHDDFSAVVSKNFATTNVNTTSEEITITGHGLSNGHMVSFTTTGGLPTGLAISTVYYVLRVDANTIKVCTSKADWLAGTVINLSTQGSGTHTIVPNEIFIVVSDVNGASVNAMNNSPDGLPPKYIKVGYITTEAAYIRFSQYLWWNNSTRTGYGLWQGKRVATYDSASFEYRFRGGYCGIVIHTRLASTWYIAGILDWDGDSNLVEGTDKYGVLASGITAGNSVVVQLGAGQAANFTQNKFYFAFDFQNHSWVEYLKVINVNTGADQITIDNSEYSFPAGTVIGAYPHRFAAFGNISDYEISELAGRANNYPYNNGWGTKAPYVSDPSSTLSFHASQAGVIYGGFWLDGLVSVLSRMNPDDRNLQSVMRPILIESMPYSLNSSASCNRAYGQIKDLYACCDNAFLNGSDGKIINGKNFIKFGTTYDFAIGGGLSSNTYAALLLDSESLT